MGQGNRKGYENGRWDRGMVDKLDRREWQIEYGSGRQDRGIVDGTGEQGTGFGHKIVNDKREITRQRFFIHLAYLYPVIHEYIQVLIGVGKLLRLYDLGRKKLLRKCENKHIPHIVVDIKTVGERIIVSDVQVRN